MIGADERAAHGRCTVRTMRNTIALGILGSLSLAGCGGPTTQATPRGGCPSAETVALATWNPGGDEPQYQGSPVEPAWLVRLGYREPAGGRWGDDEGAPASSTEPVLEAGPVQGYDIAKLGLGPLPGEVWLLRPELPACLGKIAGYVAVLYEDGPRSLGISAVLTGCPGPTDDNFELGWISFAGGDPTGCSLVLPEKGTERAGAEADEGVFSIERAEVNRIPSPWESTVPDEPCANCEQLWSVSAVSAETGPVVAQVIVTDVVPPADDTPASACELETHTRAGIYAVGESGPPVHLGLEDVGLHGALVDTRGVRVALGTGIDRWAAVDVLPDARPGASRTVQYFIAHEEDSLWLSMAPYCGP